MTNLNLKSAIASVVSVSLLLSLIACQKAPQSSTQSTDSPASVKVRPSHEGLPEDSFQAEIVKIGLEKLGDEVESDKILDYTAKLLAIANDELDYTMSHWEKNHQVFFDKSGGEEKLERVGAIIPQLLQGYQIDRKTANEYNITNIEQLQQPEIAQLFDSDGDGKANLAGCDPGWGCEAIIEHHLNAYQLQETVEHDQGKYPALIADTITRYNQGEPILYYTWTPYWVSSVLKPNEDVVWLEVSVTDMPESQGTLTAADTSVEGKNLGFPVDRMRIVANKAFLAANPSARQLLQLIEIPPEDMNQESLRIKEGSDSPEDIRRHAQEWVEENQERFDSWIEEATKAQ
ncbi:MAG: glycine betaine/L-proline ABC transporter substrate-binding protein ProX [Microcoleaceae cyanobacterium]